jgi:Porin subfamily
MKMVKSLLLGSAAALVAATAGQAAELPVKARPVQYVKVCSLYGAGFYYMPGTDMCIKIGGWVRAEISGGSAVNGNITWGPYNNNANNRGTSNLVMRARGYITADAREQTAYGVARGYIAVGLSTSDVGLNTAANQFSANRAYVQWAGFTAGLAQSFYDFYSVPAAEYRGGYLPASDTGDGGWWVWGYTAQFGGGFSGTLSVEQRRTTQICDANDPASTACTITPGGYTNTLSAAAPAAAVFPGNGSYGGEQIPDVVANLRVDQAWGSAQVMAAYHDVNASYYGATAGGAPTVLSGGHPSDATGFAVGAGLKINFPMIAAGDYFQSQFNYSEGAMRYLFNTPNTNYGYTFGGGTSEAYGVMSDCVFGGSAAAPAGETGCQLTTGWGFNASFEHYWTPQWHQSLFGAYYAVRYNSSANAMLCSAAGSGNGAGVGAFAVATGGCNNDWDTWGIGSRLQWDVTKSFYLGVEAMYVAMDSASPATTLGGYSPGGATGTTAASLGASSASTWAFTLRMHKDFLP